MMGRRIAVNSLAKNYRRNFGMISTNSNNDHDTRACIRCGAAILARYAFRDCTRCAFDALRTDPELIAWRAEQRAAAYERLARAGLVRPKGDEE